MTELSKTDDTLPLKLGLDWQIPFLDSTNTELRCLALTAIPNDDIRLGQEAHHMVFPEEGPPVSVTDFNSMLARSMGKLVIMSNNELGQRQFTKKRAGIVATALGGHRLQLSIDLNVPTMALMGTHRPERLTSTGAIGQDSFADRLSLLKVLAQPHAKHWQSTPDIYDQVFYRGVSKRTLQNHLAKLTTAKILDWREMEYRHSGRIYEYRLSKNNYYDRYTLLSQFLDIIDRFATLGPDFLTNGLKKADTILNDRRYVGGLVRRALVTDANYRSVDRSSRRQLKS